MHPSVRSLTRQRLGFIGLGQMGYQMAFNLFLKTATASGSRSSQPPKFTVCDPNENAVAELSNSLGNAIPGCDVAVAGTPAEVARDSDVVITMLPSSPQVKDVYLSTSGILAGIKSLNSGRGSSVLPLLIDSTTLDVQVAQDLAKRVDELGARIVDAPVSGGVVGARAASLSFMVGGPDESFKLAQPFLALMGARVIHCGASGTGLIAKLCNNHILGINQIAIAEGMLLGTSLGLAPDLLASIINSSTGRSWPSEINNPVPGALPEKSPPCERGYDGGFASRLMLKDMLLASSAAKPSGVPLPLGDRSIKLYESVAKSDRANKDFSVVYDYLKEIMKNGDKA